jgi:hypothetical protein
VHRHTAEIGRRGIGHKELNAAPIYMNLLLANRLSERSPCNNRAGFIIPKRKRKAANDFPLRFTNFLRILNSQDINQFLNRAG